MWSVQTSSDDRTSRFFASFRKSAKCTPALPGFPRNFSGLQSAQTPSRNKFVITMPQNFGQLPEELQLATSAHVKYIQSLDARKDEYDYWLTEHLRLNGLYWGLTSLHLLGHPDALPRAETIDFVLSCQHDSGGFGAAPGHDAHMLSTVSAVQILAMVDAFDQLETRGKGKAQVGKCASTPCVAARIDCLILTLGRWAQTLPVFRIPRRARSPATSGEKRTRAFSTVLSMRCRSSGSFVSST
jgi:hypothetical protein